MKISKNTLKEIKIFEDYCYENAENLCKHFNAFDSYGFSVNSNRVFFTTAQTEGNHWARVMSIDEFNTLVNQLREQSK